MVPGFVMVMGGSGLRWYNQNDKQHKMLGVLGGQLIVAAQPFNEYLTAHRCYDCNSVLASPNSELSDHDQAAVDKAE